MASKQMYMPRKPIDWGVVASEIIDLFAEHDVRAKGEVLDAISSMFSEAPTLAVTERMLGKLAYLSGEYNVNNVHWVQSFTKNRFVRRSARLKRELDEVIYRIPVERLTRKAGEGEPSRRKRMPRMRE
jgi:pantothenate kinase